MSSPVAQPPGWESYSVQELEEALRYHNRKYWIDDDPEISDPEFDRLVEALRVKAPNSDALQEIGPAGADVDALDEESEKVSHDPPMLSLGKCYEEETLLKWYDKFEGNALVTPKIDGVAASIRYDASGRLQVAATRGSGELGEVMTAQARQIENLPHQIDLPDDALQGLEVRGEAVMPIAVFQEHFQHDYASPRNLTAGALKRDDPQETARYQIAFFAFDLLGVELDEEQEKMKLMDTLGFAVPDYQIVDRDGAQALYDDISDRRAALPYETDGVVYKVNRVDEQQRMGHTAHHPRYALAYKFLGDAGETTLRDIQWSVSRTGAINPVGVVDPVELSGAEVSRVSLHNLAIMEHLGGQQGLTLGARVKMRRRGGVIPNLEEVLEPGHTPITIPSTCPGCGAETRRDNDVLVADHGDDCRSAQIRRLRHFVSELGIKGFGPKLLEQLYDRELVTNPVDFFTLDVPDLLTLERVGQKTADKQLRRIDRATTPDVRAFLRALGIDELSHHVANLLVEHFDSLEAIRQATPAELVDIHTIGDVIAQKVTQGFDEHDALIDDLLQYMTPQFPTLEEDSPEVSDSPLAGKKVLFTGKMESMSRSEAKDEVKRRGGECPSSVVKSLDYLVMGDADMERFQQGWRTNKIKKAQRYQDDGADLQIISESDFLPLLDGD